MIGFIFRNYYLFTWNYLFSKIYLTFNWPLDWITFAIIVWNFSVVGMFSIFWRAPVKTTQFYLIAISALMVYISYSFHLIINIFILF